MDTEMDSEAVDAVEVAEGEHPAHSEAVVDSGVEGMEATNESFTANKTMASSFHISLGQEFTSGEIENRAICHGGLLLVTDESSVDRQRKGKEDMGCS